MTDQLSPAVDAAVQKVKTEVQTFINGHVQTLKDKAQKAAEEAVAAADKQGEDLFSIAEKKLIDALTGVGVSVTSGGIIAEIEAEAKKLIGEGERVLGIGQTAAVASAATAVTAVSTQPAPAALATPAGEPAPENPPQPAQAS